MMDEQYVFDCLTQEGYFVDDVTIIPQGNSHYNFDVRLNSGEEVIVRFDKPHCIAPDGYKRDYHYNGVLSLEREVSICSLLRKKVGLPAPEIKASHRCVEYNFLVVEKMPGRYWSSFVQENNFSLDKYLASLEYLGGDIAQAHKWTFPSHGNVMDENRVEPENISHFSQRLEQIISLRLDRALQSQSLSEKEFGEINSYFRRSILNFANQCDDRDNCPVLILTDLHPMNFFVDSRGKPSAYFDLEFCQAGVPALEMYNLGLQLFSYFDQTTFDLARKSFFNGYVANGGRYDVEDMFNKKVETLLCAGHTLSAVTGYYGMKDGLRDMWSAEFKDILFKVLATEQMDYVAFADVIRQKTGQPKKPSIS